MLYLNYNLKRNVIVDDSLKNEIFSKRNECCDFEFIKQLKDHSFENIHKYPDIYTAKKILCSKLEIEESSLIFGNGSDDVLKNLFFTLDYKSLHILSHSYKMAYFYNDLLYKKIIQYDFKYSDAFEISTEILGDNDGLFYLVNPHCPTTFKFTSDQILDLSRKFKYLILDEAYTSPLNVNQILSNIKNIFIVKSFSKLGGCPGLRIGYVVNSDLDILNKINVISSNHPINSEAVRYIKFITNNQNLLCESEYRYLECFNYIKHKLNLKGMSCSNFSIFEYDIRLKDIGVEYEIDGRRFLRITLTDINSFKSKI